MGLIIIFGIGLAFAITVLAINEIKWWSDGISILGVISIFIFGIGFLITVSFALCIQIPKEKDYQQAVYERQVIEYRLENQDKNLVGNELLFTDIVEFNNNLRNCKRYKDNFWIGLFYNDKIATIDYVTIEGVDNYTD